ncbi:MAG: HD domain-containing phosphohydrolase [Clostridium sp.]
MDKLYRTLLESMTFPVWVKSVDGRFTFVNESFCKMYNKKIEDFVGKTLEDVFPIEVCKLYNLHCKEVVETKKPVKKEMKRNSYYTNCTVLPLINSQGDIEALAGIVGVTKDQDKLQEKNEQVRQEKDLTGRIIDALPGTIFYKDIKGKYVYANKECIDVYRRLGVEDVVGKTDGEINPDNDQVAKFKEDDKRIIETKLPIFNSVVFKYGDGTKGYKEVIKVPLMDNHGNVVGIIGRALDITDKKKTEEKLKYLSYSDALTGTKNRLAFDISQKKFSRRSYMPLGVIMGDVNGLKVVNDTFGHIEGDKLLIQICEVLGDVLSDKGEIFRFGGDEFVMLIPNYDRSECENIVNKIGLKCHENNSNLYNLSIALGIAIKENTRENIYDVLKEAEESVYRKKLFDNISIKNSILNSLKIGLEINSEETEEHNSRVAENCIKLGSKLGLNNYELDELKISAELHDIGMIGVSKDLIFKKETLTSAEFEVIKSHTEKGYRIIKASKELKRIAESVLYHHERWDGKGYPMGLKGKEIPLHSRIICICDAYDSMIRDKVYKKAMSKKEAIDELIRCRGTQFDSELVDVFINILL